MKQKPFEKLLIALMLCVAIILSAAGSGPVTVYATGPEAGVSTPGSGATMPETDTGISPVEDETETVTEGGTDAQENTTEGTPADDTSVNGTDAETPGNGTETVTEIIPPGSETENATGDNPALPADAVIPEKYTQQGDETAFPDAETLYEGDTDPSEAQMTPRMYAGELPLLSVEAPKIRLVSSSSANPDGEPVNHSITEIPEGEIIRKTGTGARIRLSSATQDAQIYYRVYPSVEEAYADTSKFNDFLSPVPESGIVETDCPHYTEDIILSPDFLSALGKQDGENFYRVTIWAIAVKYGYANSGYSAATIHVYENGFTEEGTPDWGDVSEDDAREAGYENPSDLPEGIWIAGVATRTYSGAAQTFPDLRVYHNRTLLKAKTDYTVSCANNVKAATADAKNAKGVSVAPTVIVTGRGSYSGQYFKTFTIEPLDITENALVDADGTPLVTAAGDIVFRETGAHMQLAWNGKVQKGKLALTYADPFTGKSVTLKENTDYTLVWKKTVKTVTAASPEADRDLYGEYDADAFKAPGIWEVAVLGKGNCTGERTWKIEIINTNPARSGVGDASDTKIMVSTLSIPAIPAQVFQYAVDDANAETGKGKQFVYAPEGSTASSDGQYDTRSMAKLSDKSGTAFVWKITDKSKNELVFERDFDLTDYRLNDRVGTASVTVYGKGRYAGTRTVRFQINPVASLTRVTFDGVASSKYKPANGIYTGIPHEPRAVLTAGAEAKVLTEGKDYTVSFSNSTNAGSATVLYNGINGYTGTVKKAYRILPYDLAADAGSVNGGRLEITYPETVAYEKGGARPVPAVTYTYQFADGGEIRTYRKTLVSGTDYTLSWKNNTVLRARDAKNPPTVIIKGRANFKGTRTGETFTIIGKDLASCTVTAPDVIYTGKKGRFKSVPVVRDVNGAVLKAGTDYDASKTVYHYAGDTTLADFTVRRHGDPVEASDIVPSGTVLRATVTGKGNYAGENSGLYRVVSGDLSKAVVKIDAQYYTGKEIRLTKREIVVSVAGRVLADTDYEIVSYSNNVKKGRASVTLRGVGAYGKEKTAVFSILQRPVSFVIRYDANRATSGTMKLQTALPGTKVRLAGNAFKRANYTFQGWNTMADGTGTSYSDKALYPGDAAEALIPKNAAGTCVTLYAQWEPVSNGTNGPAPGGGSTSSYYSELTNMPISASLQNQRPIAVMIDNEQVALPHYGMSEADVVYELMNSTANNRITRFMAIYKDWKQIPRIGNVRSTRPTNALLFPEWNAVLFHEGAPYVHTNPYFGKSYTPNIDGGFPRIANGKDYEFTSYLTGAHAVSRMKAAGIPESYTGYPESGTRREHFRFMPDGGSVDLATEYKDVISGQTADLSTAFPKNMPTLRYHAGKGVYEYSEYGTLHRDAEDGAVLSFENVILQKADVQVLDENGYLIYNVINSPLTYREESDGWYLSGGKAVRIVWYKGAPTEYTKFYALNNRTDSWHTEITLNPGKTYIALVPSDHWDKVSIY